ncbi:Predicted ATPase [Armatimonadetes bacterium GBS]|jgi:predicted ATPase|nr:Predicted ATPase [Armatimonadetes bacterium GBS]CUU37935.1 Predicted ATPase [Armatimonadetes bacterium GXS]
MLRRIEVLSYKCLRYIQQELAPFHILVGPNASGKSSFLDVLVFLQDMLRNGVERAVRKRARTVRELTWQMQSDYFEVAVEFSLPEAIHRASSTPGHEAIRYEARVGVDTPRGGVTLLVENLWLQRAGQHNGSRTAKTPLLFPGLHPAPAKIVVESRERTPPGRRKVMSRTPDGRIYFRSETTDWNFPLRPMREQAGLTLIPDEERFPASFWLQRTLLEGVRFLMLNSRAMREPCPPDAPEQFQLDGSNLPIVVDRLAQKHSERFNQWIAHVQTVLPEVKTIRVEERPEDRYRYLVMETFQGTRIPSWLLSDGTLRFLALTLLPYIVETHEIYIIEEPENGIHPRAIEAVYQSLSSVYAGQVLCATHSPILLNLAQPDNLLCFSRDNEGATEVVRGDQHPRLKAWRKEVALGDLLASGVLG